MIMNENNQKLKLKLKLKLKPTPNLEETKVILKYSPSYWDYLDNIGLNMETKNKVKIINSKNQREN